MRVWSRQGYYMQHMEELWMESHIDLYREDGDAAWDRMTRQWPSLRRSLLMRGPVDPHRHAAPPRPLRPGEGRGRGDRHREAQALLDAAERDARLRRA